MQHWFALPQLEDEYDNFAARVLHYTLLILACVALSFTLFVSALTQLVFIPVLLVVLGVCYYLLHIGRLRLASLIFLSGLWLTITVASFLINGILNASISTYTLVIIFSAVLVSNRAVVVFTTLSILSLGVLLLGDLGHFLPLRTTELFIADRFFQQLALFTAAGILLSAASRMIRGSLRRVHKQEETLLERNRALETEIAERRRAEAELRVSEEKYRLLFENIPVLATVYGDDGQIMLTNKAAAQFFETTPEALQGRNVRDMYAPQDAERGIANHARVVRERKPMFIQRDITLPNGRQVYYERHIMPLPDNGEGDPQVLSLTIDVTERHLAEQRERELAQAQERNTFLTDFFSTLSHDFKTPLTIMNTSLYLLKRAETPEQREERIARIGEQVELLDIYIRDMLTIARLEHLPSINFEPLGLNTLIEEVIDLLRPRMERKQIHFQFNPAPALQPMHGDTEQLRRMLINLIENAINYTPSGGHVTVTTHADDGAIKLDIQDSGIGIEPEAVPHIFERFFRTPNARASEKGGTGLGLAIVKKIAETHAATINVDSQLGAGTTFSIHFPAELALTTHPI